MAANNLPVVRFGEPEMSEYKRKQLKYIAGGVIGLAAVLAVRKYIKNKKAQQELTDYTAALQQVTVNKSNLTISESEASLIANNLYAAMESTGTDEKTILALLQNRSADDLKLIVKAFGVRPYGTFGKPLYSWMPSTNLDLMGWLRKELSGSTLNKAQAIFTNAGIVF